MKYKDFLTRLLSKLNQHVSIPIKLYLAYVFLFVSPIESLFSGEITLVRTIKTWEAGIIKSTVPAGITYHAPTGHLFIVDSEIDEISEIWNCENIFEVNLSGDQIYNSYDAYVNGGLACDDPNVTHYDIRRDREPTGITYNEFDGFYYITNDDRTRIMRYNGSFMEAVDAQFVQGYDLEGITSDPSTGFLYVVEGGEGINGDKISKVLVYNSNLELLTEFPVNDRIGDPEGIAYNKQFNHLFLVSQSDLKIFEYTLTGNFVTDYDISSFDPVPIDPQGLTFAPTSDQFDNPENLSIYIADGQRNNGADPALDRDGVIYEASIKSTSTSVTQNYKHSTYNLIQNYPNPFNPETQITFNLSETAHIIIQIYDVHGRELRTLLNNTFPMGAHSVLWDGKDSSGAVLPSGIYFYKYQSENFIQFGKMIFLK